MIVDRHTFAMVMVMVMISIPSKFVTDYGTLLSRLEFTAMKIDTSFPLLKGDSPMSLSTYLLTSPTHLALRRV